MFGFDSGAGFKSKLVALIAVVSSTIYLIGVLNAGPFTSNGTQPPLAFPLQQPANCQSCHGDYDPNNNIEPNNTWEGSMMANSARDPLFWAALDVANNDVPGIGDWCMRCHVPHGWYAGRSEPPGGSFDGCSLQGRIDEKNNDFTGISCHQCHRVMENDNPPMGQQSLYDENGQLWLDDENCLGAGEPCRRGPYDYTSGLNPPPHAWIFSPLHTESAFCAQCHNVTSPAENLIIGGVDQGIPYPIERTFKEWENSDYRVGGTSEATCQNCHMVDSTADPSFACSFQSNNHVNNMPIHQFAGGNSWVPDVLAGEYPNLNIGTQLAATKTWALDMLQNQSATIEVTADAAVGEGGTLNTDVKVTNLSGHKLPTGYPEGRRMWVNVVARDGSNNVIFESGAYDSSTGVLTKDSQVKIYETKPGIWNNTTMECETEVGGKPQFHFVQNNCYAKDNRIPPLGFTGASDIEMQFYDYSYPETFPGSGVSVNYDITSYSIPVPVGTPSPITVTARLYYQIASKDYVEFLRDEAVDNSFPNDCIERTSGFPTMSRGEYLYDVWERYGRAAPVEMVAGNDSSTIVTPTPGEASGSTDMLAVGFSELTGAIGVSYDPACTATDHTIYYGPLDQVSTLSYTGQACGLGVSGNTSFIPGIDSAFWLIVGNDGSAEGSYGQASGGGERSEDSGLATCPLPQDLSGSCDP